MVAPGAGTLIGAGAGALIGGLGGLFSDDKDAEQQRRLEEYYASLANREAPQLGAAGQAGYSNFRQNQSNLINRLEALSAGKGPSLAAQQFQQATDRNLGAQQAMAATGRGGAMGAFNAANNMGMLGTQAAQGSAMARTNEQLQAFNQLGLSIYGARGADEDMNRFNTGEQNKFAMANLDARLKTMGLNDQTRLAILQQFQQGAMAPTFGEQLLAGGAGAFAQAGSMGAFRGGGVPRGGMAGSTSGLGVGGGGIGLGSVGQPYNGGNPWGY
jgi:hypothetical protein